jgi:hypothetical protein
MSMRVKVHNYISAVMAGFMPAIHVLRAARKVMDGRDKPGHDERESCSP